MNKRTQERKSFLADSREPVDEKTEIVFKSIRFDAQLAETLGDYVHAKKKKVRTSIDAEVQRAVREMFAREAKGELPPTAPVPSLKPIRGYPEEHKEWHDKLETILREGGEKDLIGIQSNLEWAVNDIAARALKRKRA